MRSKIGIIIGTAIFILILGCTYINQSNARKKDNNNSISNTTIQDTEIKQGEIVYRGKLPMPIENFIQVTSKFGYRESHGVVHSNHTGIDLCGSLGSSIMAVKDGEVTHAGKQGGYGNCVEIKHSTENGTIYYTFYAHLARIDVIEGQEIQQGTVVGIQGGDPNRDPNPGYSTGSHLHFEIKKSQKGDFINPREYLFGNKEV